jgi:2'-5' RNA ligase
VDAVVSVAAEVARAHAPMPVPFDQVGRFGRAGALWLGPTTLPRDVARLQRDADAALVAAGWDRAFGQHSEPAQWVAHCTLATRIAKPELRAVQQQVQRGYRPFTARIDALAVILVGGRGDIAHLPL